MDCSLPGSSVHEIFQARSCSGLLFASAGVLPGPGIEHTSLALQVVSRRRILYAEPPGWKSLKDLIVLFISFSLVGLLSAVPNQGFPGGSNDKESACYA